MDKIKKGVIIRIKSNIYEAISRVTLVLFLSIFVFLITPGKALAYSRSEIIPDEVFRSPGTMTEAQIQTFLEARGSFLAGYKIPAPHTRTYWVGSKQVTSYINSWIGPVGQEVNATGWPVSRVIHRAANWYGVNPQVIISILQKESSMITDGTDRTDDSRFARMAWIMGYAFTEDQANPIKSVCGTSTNYNPSGSCAGVAMQIDWATGGLDSWYNRSVAGTLMCGVQNCSKGKTITIDGSSVYIGNFITGPFYRYTPHYTWAGTFTWCMQNWFPYPGITPVTTSLAFSSLSPAAGETLQASYRLKNISSVAVTIDAGLADQNTRTGQWNSFSPQRNITIEPGETRTFAFTKTVRFPGPHHTWIAIGQNGVWHNARPATNQLVNYSYTVQSPEKVVPVSASLAFSNLSPAAGETLDGGFTLRSNAKGSITVDVGFADYNTQSGKWNSFSPQRGITLSPGETRRLSFSKTSKFPGPHRTWIAIGHDGVWYDARPLTNQLTAYSYQVRNPRIEISKFFFNSVPPVLNQEFTATVAIKNLEPREIKMVGLGVPVFNSVNNTWRTLNSNITNFTLAPGETQNYTFRRTLTESGYYNIWPSYMVDDAWLTGTNQNGIFLFWSGWVR
jgi:hypothetical protein